MVLSRLNDKFDVVLCDVRKDLMSERSTAVFQRQQIEDFSQVSALDDAQQDLIIVAARSVIVNMRIQRSLCPLDVSAGHSLAADGFMKYECACVCRCGPGGEVVAAPAGS